jgi:putative endonuclease
MPFIYVLRCADRSLFVGRTDDMTLCEQTHNHGHGGQYTKARRPVYLAYTEEVEPVDRAERRERQLKRWPEKKLEALVAGRLPLAKRSSTLNTKRTS